MADCERAGPRRSAAGRLRPQFPRFRRHQSRRSTMWASASHPADVPACHLERDWTCSRQRSPCSPASRSPSVPSYAPRQGARTRRRSPDERWGARSGGRQARRMNPIETRSSERVAGCAVSGGGRRGRGMRMTDRAASAVTTDTSAEKAFRAPSPDDAAQARRRLRISPGDPGGTRASRHGRSSAAMSARISLPG